MIGTDAQLLDASSGAVKKTIEYGETFGELDILLLISEGSTEFHIDYPHVRVYPVCGKFSRFWKGYLLGRKLMQEKKYDAISAQDVEKSVLALALSREFGVPWQMQIHTDIFSPHFKEHSIIDRMRVLLAKSLIPKANGVRVVSQRIKTSIFRLGLLKEGAANIAVLPIFLDVTRIRAAPVTTDLHKKYPEKFILLMPTRLSKEKNIGMAIEAIKLLVSDGTAENVLLLIVGKGPERDALEKLVADKKLGAYVLFEAWTDDLPSYYKTADLYLLTSVYEGGARAPLEALAAALPVMMTDVAPAHEEVRDGYNGIVVPVGDTKELASKIGELLEDRVKLAKLKEGAAASLSSPISKEEYLQLYKKLLVL